MKIRWVSTDQPSMFEGLPLQRAYAVCDSCGEPISADRPGLGVWPLPGPDADPDADADVTFVHKGTCDVRGVPDATLDVSRIAAGLFLSSATPSERARFRKYDLATPEER